MCFCHTVAGEAPYWVLSTDYDNYAVVWSCNQVALLNFRKSSLPSDQSKGSCFPAKTERFFLYVLRRNCLVLGPRTFSNRRDKETGLPHVRISWLEDITITEDRAN